MAVAIGTNTFTVAKWIVSPDATQGTHTTWTAACAVASSGDTIWGREGTYTENFTVPAGVSLAGASPTSTIINGTITYSSAGSYNISNLQLRTNGAIPALSISGTGAIGLNVVNCFIGANTNTAIVASNSSISTAINLMNCNGNVTSGQALFSVTSSNQLSFLNSIIGIGLIGGESATSNTISAGTLVSKHSWFGNPITTSGTASINLQHTEIDASGFNAVALTVGGSGTSISHRGIYQSGTASACSVGTGATLDSNGDSFNSSNTNAVTGVGTIQLENPIYSGSSHSINTTTQTGGVWGANTTAAPLAGCIGETITSNNTAGIVLSTTITANVNTISLTPGTWLVSTNTIFESNVSFAGGVPTYGGASTASATLQGSVGSQYTVASPDLANSYSSCTHTGRTYTVTSTSNLYHVAQSTFSAGSLTAFGSIYAVRVC